MTMAIEEGIELVAVHVAVESMVACMVESKWCHAERASGDSNQTPLKEERAESRGIWRHLPRRETREHEEESSMEKKKRAALSSLV